MRRVRVVALVGLIPLGIGVGVLMASSAQGVSPGPVNLPAVQLIAQNACNGNVVKGLTASFLPTSGEVSPGPAQKVGLTHAWKAGQFQAGTYALVLSAPGYVGIGSASAGTSPISVTINPGPTQLGTDQSLSVGQVVAVTMVPSVYPPNPCVDLPPAAVPALAGSVFDGATKAPLINPGPIQLTAVTSGEVSPGPTQNPGADSFAYPEGTVPAGIYDLSVATNGFVPLGTQPGGSLTPVQVSVQPGPQQLPTGGSFVVGEVLEASLAPSLTLAFAVEPAGTYTAGQLLRPVSPVVKVTDSKGNPVAGVVVTLIPETFSFASPSMTTAVTNSSGLASFAVLVIDTPGTNYRILATAADAPSVLSTTFSVVAPLS